PLLASPDSSTPYTCALPLHDALPISEVRRFDDQRIALEVATRIPKPLPQVFVEMRALVERDDTGAMDHLGSNHHVSGALEDLKLDRKSTRLNSSHQIISYAVFSLYIQ